MVVVVCVAGEGDLVFISDMLSVLVLVVVSIGGRNFRNLDDLKTVKE